MGKSRRLIARNSFDNLAYFPLVFGGIKEIVDNDARDIIELVRPIKSSRAR